jgi:hypothetical protein
MFMAKRAISITLDEDNVLWLKGRAAATRRRSLSDTIDEVVTAARTGGHGATASRSVAGTVDIADVDPDLETADEYLRATFAASLGRPVIVHEARATFGRPPARSRPRKTGRRG